MDFRQEIISLLASATKKPSEEIDRLLAVPPSPELGDYAFPCFILGKNPKEAAEKLKAGLPLTLLPFIEKAEVAGPYLNFFLKRSVLVQETLSAIHREARHYGQPKIKGQRIVIEYCGPNTNKPLHLGHIRNMALGNALTRILSFVGHDVHPVNIINDRGIHICKSMLAYQHWGQGKQPDKKGDHFVGDFYVLFDKAAKEEEKLGKDTLHQEAQEMLVKWEQGDKDVRASWKKMNSWVLQGFKETYQRFGVTFEKEYFESEYYERAKEIVQEGIEKGVFKVATPEHPIVSKKDNLQITSGTVALLDRSPHKTVLREDGTSIYITQDLYLANARYRDFKFHQLLYVVASEQNTHFQQLFEILEKLGKPYAKYLHHFSYGMVHLPSGRMKSREGTVVDADDLMDEVARLAASEIEKRHPQLSAKEIKLRAEHIALGAIKFFMVHTDAIRDIVYHPEASLSFEGETGPYVQYTHARACSLLRKAQEEHHQAVPLPSHIPMELLSSPQEMAVIRLLAAFSEKVLQAAEQHKVHILATYLISLAQAFNEFYHACPVLSEEKGLMKARLLLVDSVRQVLANGLTLLGIQPVEEM